MNKVFWLVLALVGGLAHHTLAQEATREVQVLVVGGGASGVCAGIQAARQGAKTLIVEPSPWLGGMLTAAGVSATDGNHHLPSGLWAEFRQQIEDHYGGPAKVATGWVSNTLFEPSVGNRTLQQMAAREPNLEVLYGHELAQVNLDGQRVAGASFASPGGARLRVRAAVTIDATELGDVLATAGVPYDIGMEARSYSQEAYGVEVGNSFIQDFTFAAILKDYGPGADKTIAKPTGYDPKEFDCACADYCSKGKVGHSAQKMLDYGKLPNGKYMLNWPINGNDYYANMIEASPAQRAEVYAKAKLHTLGFVYFIQTELGFKHLGLADDEFPTADRLPFMPYHRESRRMKGVVRYRVGNLVQPYQGPPLYRTGAAVGDYPVDHHHSPKKGAPGFDFPKVPSFTVPLGALLPQAVDGLLVAEKSISVSNIVNGSTRLQPCVMLIGQAAGAWAAHCALANLQPRQARPRAVQQHLLGARAYLQPYYDVKPTDPNFAAIQRVGSCGLLKGRGEPYQWANRTWFYPDSLATVHDLRAGLRDLLPSFASPEPDGQPLSPALALRLLQAFAAQAASQPAPHLRNNARPWRRAIGAELREKPSRTTTLTRAELAALLDELLDPFHRIGIDWEGNFGR
jgi:hypothetical protein